MKFRNNKYCILTLDTEGDNLWEVRNSDWSIARIVNRNGEYLERFQILCEKYGLIPTYLVDYEMSLSAPFINMAERHREGLEIGMHMHAWNNPPICSLPDRYGGHKPYIGEYPKEIQKQKVEYITRHLEDTFQRPIRSHRGGRWYIDPAYINILHEYGYTADCTVTPGIDWTYNSGQCENSKGIDYRKAPRGIYELSELDVSKKGNAGILEIPVTTLKKQRKLSQRMSHMDLWHRGSGNSEYFWLRPDGNNIKSMKSIVDDREKRNEYLEFMIHSSELMPGGSPTFKTNASIERLYKDLEELFSYIKSKGYKAAGLSEYARIISEQDKDGAGA